MKYGGPLLRFKTPHLCLALLATSSVRSVPFVDPAGPAHREPSRMVTDNRSFHSRYNLPLTIFSAVRALVAHSQG
jgi:hypothetical protein